MTAADLYGSYLDSAAVAVALLADPAVAAAWEQPSALAEFTVRGLAGHLARQVIVVRELIAAEPLAGEAVSPLDHYARAQSDGQARGAARRPNGYRTGSSHSGTASAGPRPRRRDTIQKVARAAVPRAAMRSVPPIAPCGSSSA